MKRRIRKLTLGIVSLAVVAAGDLSVALAQDSSSNAQVSPLVIETVTLPATYPRATYSVRLQQRGGIPPFHWCLEKGEMPPGLRLEDDGTLHGTPERVGEFRFTISVTDSNRPPQAVQREYVLAVTEAISMKWKVPPHVNGSRIEGSVEVSNTTADDLDFTFITLAVNENGRATAIGYQHFLLKKKTTEFEIPFGENLPHGGYVVHADGVAELAARNQIHRARLQTPGKLQVAVGP